MVFHNSDRQFISTKMAPRLGCFSILCILFSTEILIDGILFLNPTIYFYQNGAPMGLLGISVLKTIGTIKPPKKRFAILKQQSDKNIFTILAIAQAIFLPARLPLYWLWGMNY